ncbi:MULTISPECIES: HPP family protein [unclassified Meiothermus]|uniref:CBS domain-containing protein n=1 Tax=unclassified Meiothermus TaxID=370471 RepID=UPI001F179D88|nr:MULTISPECIES: CBS domain-containing protein [unclassified Meiothermus]
MKARPHSVRLDETLLVAAQRMLQHRLGGLPVVDESGKLVGLIEVDDLLPRPENVPFSEVEALRLFDEWVDPGSVEGIYRQYQSRPVASAMRTELAVVSPEDPLETALVRMLQNRQYRRVLVVDAQGQLIGTLTRSDFLRLFVMQGPSASHPITPTED